MGPRNVLAFQIQDQQGQYWCWAANAASISYFYDGVNGKTQCQIACDTFHRNDCCQSPDPCDSEGSFKNALGICGNLEDSTTYGVLATSEIATQINAGRLIGLMIIWPNNYGHFITIFGYDGTSGTDYVLVRDPQNATYAYPYFDLVNNYAQAGGKWMQTYLTVGHPPVSNQMLFSQKSLVFPATKINAIAERQNGQIKSSKVPRKKARLHAHNIYIIEYDALLKGNLTIKKSGFRILKNTKAPYFADFSDTEHKLIGLCDDQNFIKLYLQRWDKIKEKIRQVKKPYTVQVLQLPQIGVESLKLEFHGDAISYYFPVKLSFIFEEKYYNEDEFMKILEVAAIGKIEAMKKAHRRYRIT